jgi:hypothetical protein
VYVISGNFDLEVWEFGCYCIFPLFPLFPIDLLLHFEFELAKDEYLKFFCFPKKKNRYPAPIPILSLDIRSFAKICRAPLPPKK